MCMASHTINNYCAIIVECLDKPNAEFFELEIEWRAPLSDVWRNVRATRRADHQTWGCNLNVDVTIQKVRLMHGGVKKQQPSRLEANLG